MKTLFLFLASVFLVSYSLDKNEKKSQSFYANVSQCVITPPVGTFVNEPRGKTSTGIHDNLFVKAIAIGDGINIFVIVSFDLIGFDESFIKNIREAVFDSAGIKAEQLMLACTHSHNTPITFDAMHAYPEEGLNERNEQWEKQMIATTASTVKSSVNNLKKVSISQGKASVQIGFNRRINETVYAGGASNPHGPMLKETDVVFINNIDSEIAVLFSYASHPVSVHATSSEFSADYPGFAADYISSRYPRSVPIFLQGCGGNILSSFRPDRGYKEAELVGKKLGEAVLKGVESSKKINPCQIIYGQRNFFLPYREIDVETAGLVVKRIEESMETMKEREPDFKPSMANKDMIKWGQKVKYIAENKGTLPGLSFKAMALALGRSIAIISFPDEMLVEYALYIKEHSPFDQTIVLGYTNGVRSYIPTAEAFYLGGYEPVTAQGVYGQPFLSPACDKIIKTESIDLLNELWKKCSAR